MIGILRSILVTGLTLWIPTAAIVPRGEIESEFLGMRSIRISCSESVSSDNEILTDSEEGSWYEAFEPFDNLDFRDIDTFDAFDALDPLEDVGNLDVRRGGLGKVVVIGPEESEPSSSRSRVRTAI